MRRPLVLLSSLLVTPAWGADLSLSPGDDLGTLVSGVAPGDTVTLASGEYPMSTRITLSELAGTESAPIIIQAAEDANPVLVYSGNGSAIDIVGSSFVRVRNIGIRGGVHENPEENYNHSGVYVSNGSSDVVLEGLRVGNLQGTPINIGDAARVTVRGCELHDVVNGTGLVAGCGNGNCWLTGGTFSRNWIHGMTSGNGIYLHDGNQAVSIKDNVVHGVSERGIRVGGTGEGPENVVEGNAIWATGGHGLVANGPSTVRNNVVFDCGGNGIRSDGGTTGFADVHITHNTVGDTMDDSVELDEWSGKAGCVLANNAISNPTGYALQAGDGQIDAGNLIVANVVTGLVRGFDPLLDHYVPGYGDGDYMDAVNWDFYPRDGSALIDAADPSGDAWVPAVDFNGVARDGETPDVGAYERTEATNPGWAFQEGFKPDTLAGGEVEVEGCGDCEDEGGETATALLPLLLLGGLRRRRGMA